MSYMGEHYYNVMSTDNVRRGSLCMSYMGEHYYSVMFTDNVRRWYIVHAIHG